MKVPESLLSLPVAHRGLHGESIPENSLAAFCAAADRGYAIETDVRFTKDRRLVLFHDDAVDRMTDGAGNVSAFCLGDLKALRLGNTEERIPLLEELLQKIEGKVPLLLEIKDMPGVSGAEIAAAIAETMERHRVVYAVQSFQPMYVKAYKKRCPDIACGLLASAQPFTKADFGGSPLWRVKAHILKNMSLNFAVKPDFVSYRVQDLPNKRVSAFRGAKFAWTVRSADEAARVRPYADNIIFENFLP